MERKINIHPVLVALLALGCLIAGWKFLTPLLFVWFAFLLMLYDILKDSNLSFGKFSIFTIAFMAIGIGAVKLLDTSYSRITLLQSIALAVPFILYYSIESFLPGKIGKFSIVLFWFSVQYLFVKLFPSSCLFITADAPSIPSEWVRWNIKTGFLGGSLWFLAANFFIYRTFSAPPGANRAALALAVLSIGVPAYISSIMTATSLQMDDLINLYRYNEGSFPYLTSGEVIPRTASWISILIIIFTLVKIKTQKT